MRELFRGMVGRLQRRSGEHLYRQVGSLVRQRIEEGELRAGDAIPPQRELSQIMKISEVTIRRALQELADDGLLEARPGSGTFVLGAASPSGSGEGRGAVQGLNRGGPAVADLAPPVDPDSLSIGIAFADLTDGYPFFRPMLEGVRAGSDRNVSVRLFDLPDGGSSRGPSPLPDLRGLHGVVMMSPVDLRLVAHCREQNLPYVLLYTDIADGQSHCIVVDYTPGVLQAVTHLSRNGRRRIALVTAGADRFSTGQMGDAYRTALEINGLEYDPALLVHAGYHENDGYRSMRQLLSADAPPDAVIFASDYQARGAMLAAHELGRKVPTDVAVIGAGNVLGETGWPVPLTTMDLQFHEVGRLACKTLESLRAGEQPAHRQSVRSSLRIGKTT